MFNVLRTSPLSRFTGFTLTNKSNIFRPPVLRQKGLVQHCSTKSVVPPQTTKSVPEAEADEFSAWNTIYHFPAIMLTASFKRLNLYPVALTAVSVPICLGLSYADICSVTTAQVCGSIGFTTTLTLLIFNYVTNNLVGYVYTDYENKKVKISFLDFRGKRQNRIFPIDDIVPRSELGRSLLKFYFPIKNHDNKEVYKIVHRYGEIYDEQAFQKVFGKD